MRVPDGRNLDLDDGVLLERVPDDGRLVLWLPGPRAGGFQDWQRISTVARAEVTVTDGLCVTAATGIRARQRRRGLLGRLLARLCRGPADSGWLLPNGEAAEQAGERENDLVLAWAREESSSLNEGALRSRWPEARGVQRLGKNLFLVAGVRGQETAGEAEAAPGDPRQAAERLLAAARAASDSRREVTALTDLGIVTLRECDARRALALHEEALALARGLGDRRAEAEVLTNLGLAALAARQPRRALEHLEQAVAYAREVGDRLTEKAALDGLGQVYAGARAPAKAVSFFEQALAVARYVGDRQHQATLLWQLAIQQAELGQRDAAVARGQEAIELLETMGRPQAASFADALQRYRVDGAGFGPGGAWPAVPSDALFGGSAVPGDRPGQSAGGPGLLRMALSAAQALGKFLGSGLKAVTPETHRRRVRACGACEHHTGLRCRVCGCFTNAKAWLPHEDCPLGKWPADVPEPGRAGVQTIEERREGDSSRASLA